MNVNLKEKHHYRKEKICSRLKIFFGIIGMMLLITACSSYNSLTEDGKYLVCSSSVISNAGVLILNPQGEKVLELPDSCIEHRISQDGFIMQPEIGEIPATDRLMITSSVSENEATVGIWDVEKECWLIEPQPGWPALSWISVNGQLELKECYLGDKIYDKHFNCIETEDEREQEFKVSEELILRRIYDEEGNSCLVDQYDNIYVRDEEFKEKNPFLQDLYKTGQISLKGVVSEKYLLIYYEHQTETEEGKYLISDYSALCDLDGVIQYPELEYTSVRFPFNQYDCLEKNFIEFKGEEEDSLPDYLNLSTDELVDFPDGCSDIGYKGNGLFLLEKDSEYTIFDASVNQTGNSFSKDGNLLDFTYVFGLQSYVIQHHENGKVVINGIEQELDTETEWANILEGKYPIIQISKRFGELRTSYVLNPEGKLMVETPKDVIYANERYYISVEHDEYHINEMVRFNILSLPNGMFNL